MFKNSLPTSQKTLYSLTETCQLILFRKIIIVYCANDMKHKYTECGQNEESLKYLEK
jgi:ribosomal protein L36